MNYLQVERKIKTTTIVPAILCLIASLVFTVTIEVSSWKVNKLLLGLLASRKYLDLKWNICGSLYWNGLTCKKKRADI